MKTLSPSATLEVRKLQVELKTLTDKPGTMTRSDAKKIDSLIAQISAIRDAGISDSDWQKAKAEEIGAHLTAEEQRAQVAHERIFRSFMSGQPDSAIEEEVRSSNDLLAGTASIIYTAGTQGGVAVPQSFQKSVELGLAQTDPLLDPNVATVIQEKSLVLKPLQLPGWDLSTIAATKVTEAHQHTSDVAPQVNQELLNAWTYRLSVGASFEFEQDVFDSAMARLGEAFGVGFARGIGEDLVNGTGSSAPQGILTGATNSTITTANSGKLVLTDFTDIYFAVNRIYRNAPKCAWLLDDPTYKLARNATDNSGRPLISLVDDKETILGKPVYICPSLTVSPSVGSSHIVFGDLSHYHVHVSNLWLRRNWQLSGYIEYGKALYTGLMRADAVVNDPTGGAMPPIVYATLHS